MRPWLKPEPILAEWYGQILVRLLWPGEKGPFMLDGLNEVKESSSQKVGI